MHSPVVRAFLLLTFFCSVSVFSQTEHKAIAYLGKASSEFQVDMILGKEYEGLDAYRWKSKTFKGVELEFGPKKSERKTKKGGGDQRYLAQVRIPVNCFTESFYGGQMPFGIEPDTKFKTMLKVLEKNGQLSRVDPHLSKYANRKEIICLYEGVKPFGNGTVGVEVILKTHSNEKNPYIIEVVFQEPGFQ